jgi:pimeloyl-ACP methyl ester carboxylesterase
VAVHPRRPRPLAVDPDAWEHDLALLARPGQDDVQLALFRDYATNRALYPAVHDWLRDSRVPVLAIWGRHDEIFAAEGAAAFRQDSPDAQVELVDGGHFLLESHLDVVAATVRDWLSTR